MVVSNIYLVFEDHENSPLSKLYRSLYESSVYEYLVYSCGVGNLENTVDTIFKKDIKAVVVLFMDIPLDNSMVIRLWNSSIKDVCNTNRGRVFPLPVVCAEYLMLSSLDACLLKKNVRNLYLAEWYEYWEDNRFSSLSSYEKFYKKVLNDYVRPCVSLDSRSTDYLCYYTSNCSPKYKDCIGLTLHDKSTKFVQSYPAYFELGKTGTLSIEVACSSLKVLHRDLVKTFNRYIEEVKQKDTRGTKYLKLLTLI